MRILAKLLLVLSRIGRKVSSLFSTVRAHDQAFLGPRSRVLFGGEIINLSGKRENVRLGANAGIRGEIFIFRNAGQIRIGDWFYLGPRSSIWSGDVDGIEIGDRVLISSDVMIHDTNGHALDAKLRFAQTQNILTAGHPSDLESVRTAPISIGDDVWIGAHAMIGKGVRIGARAVIGAHAIVLSDVLEDSVIRAGTVFREDKR
jgi:acetyltransferase-like isoleucine patch superfamily enzyme